MHYGTLFDLLLKRNLPAVVIRLLLDGYTRQHARVSWCNVKSASFALRNCVKQGGVLSPILFTVYIDSLLVMLEQSGLGCYVGNYFAGAFSYADDVVILSPTLRGINMMLTLCSNFASLFNVTFNAQKTVGIIFNNSFHVDGFADLNGTKVAWHERVKYLGNIITTSLKDDADCMLKKGQFIGSVNKLIGNFKHLDTKLRIKLFKAFCHSFYGAQMWNLQCRSLSELYTAWNKGVRAVLKLPFRTHRWMLAPLLKCSHIERQLKARCLAFLVSAINSPNSTVRGIASMAQTDARSDLGANFAFFRYHYDITFSHDMNVTTCKRLVATEPPLTDIEYCYIDICLEILYIIDGVNANGLHLNENMHLLNFLCTS